VPRSETHLTILVAARDEEESVGKTVEALRREFPDAEILVADDGSRDRTAAVAEAAGAKALRLPRLGKGQALALGERESGPGRLLLVDADLEGDLAPLLEADADLAIAAFAERQGGGFGIAKRTAGRLIRACCGFEAREPLSGQRALSEAARAACFPTAAGFGCEVRMTIDAARAGLEIREVELPLRHRPTGRDPRGFAHRARQLLDAVLACGPTAENYRGLRLPLVGWVFATREPVVTAIGLADDLFSGGERGVRSHLRAGATTGTLKALAIPLYGLARTRSLSGALLVALAANFLNQLDTRPGRALRAYLALAPLVRAPLLPAVLVAPYDLREMAMLGDAGSNALGAMLGLSSVDRFTGRGRKLAIAALVGLNLLGETHSIGELIERTPGLSHLDRLGRP
jgi:glucosyl-3-phosphoglycerate synthase